MKATALARLRGLAPGPAHRARQTRAGAPAAAAKLEVQHAREKRTA